MMRFTIRKYDFISIKMNFENFTDYTSLFNVLFRGQSKHKNTDEKLMDQDRQDRFLRNLDLTVSMFINNM